jgi:hypothetical protein
MLQCSVVDMWVQSDHILLIHPFPETLCLRARASEMCRMPVGMQPIGLQSGRPWRCHTPDIEEAVIQHFEEQPDTSTRSTARTPSVKHMLVWQVLHDEHLHPYHLQ